MSDIDKRLDSLVHWILHEPTYTPAQMKDKIKQLMADEFEKLIEGQRKIGLERFHDDKDYNIDAWIDDVDTYLVKKLEEWKK